MWKRFVNKIVEIVLIRFFFIVIINPADFYHFFKFQSTNFATVLPTAACHRSRTRWNQLKIITVLFFATFRFDVSTFDPIIPLP